MPGIKDLNRMTQAELASIWKVSTRTIQRRAECETLRHGAGQGSYYVWDECPPSIPGPESGLSQDDQPLTDRQRKDRADADLAEMERDREAENLLDAQDVRRTWEGFLGRLKENLLGLGDRCAPEIQPEHTLAERIAIIRRHVNGSLRDVVAQLRED